MRVLMIGAGGVGDAAVRIAVERAPLTRLVRLTLADMHPAAFNYLRHVPGLGCVPSAARRWRQIKKLHVSVEAWNFYAPESPGLDHLKIIDDYVRSFGPTLEKLSFAWLGGRRGPCPLALSADPLFSPPRATKKLFNELTSHMSPLPARPPRQPGSGSPRTRPPRRPSHPATARRAGFTRSSRSRSPI